MPKKVAESVVDLPEFTELDGHELLIAPWELKTGQRTRLVGRLNVIRQLSEKHGEDSLEAMDGIADLLDYVSEHYAVDSDAWEDWARDKQLDALVTLVGAYMQASGKSQPSSNQQ